MPTPDALSFAPSGYGRPLHYASVREGAVVRLYLPAHINRKIRRARRRRSTHQSLYYLLCHHQRRQCRSVEAQRQRQEKFPCLR